MGRWKSATFTEYIQDELASYVSGMSKTMKQRFNYVNITSVAFADIDNVTCDMVKSKYTAAA